MRNVDEHFSLLRGQQTPGGRSDTSAGAAQPWRSRRQQRLDCEDSLL
jgi:hypothetical protein